MNKCDYCGQDIGRHVFCSPSHQVMFSRGMKAPVKTENPEKDAVGDKPTQIQKQTPKPVPKPALNPVLNNASGSERDKLFSRGLCKHGTPAALCFNSECRGT